MNEEILEREKLREEEITKFKLSLEDASEQQQRTLELEMMRRRQELESNIFARNAKLQDALLEKDRLREEEAAALKLELEAKYLFLSLLVSCKFF